MTPPDKPSGHAPKAANQRKRSRPTVPRDLVAIRKERAALTLQLETVRRILMEIAGLIRGTFIRFTRITPADRTRVGFFSPLNAVRTLLDEVIREECTRNQQKTIFVSECKPTVTDRKRSGK